MATLRKKNPTWKPFENQALEVGETIEISDYRRLVESGDAELVDEQGNVLPLPGTVFVCGICYEKIDSHAEYVEHVMEKHAATTNLKKEDVPNEKEEGIKVPSSFGERMAKARAAARAKRLEAKGQ